MKNIAIIAATTVFLAASPAAFAQTASGSGEQQAPTQQTNPSMTLPEMEHQKDQSNSAPTLRSGTTDVPTTGSSVQPENGTDASDPAVTPPAPGQERTGNSQGNSSGTY